MSAIERPVAPDDAGRPCPFCRFALKAGTRAAQCPACSAVHHADCWADNGGCAIMGCTGAPGASAAAPPPAAVPPPPPTSPPAGGPPPPPPAAPQGSNRMVLIAVLAAALVVAGSTVAVALSRSGHSDGAVAAVVTTVVAVTTTPTPAPDPAPASTSTVTTPDDAPTADDAPADDRAAIERVLTAYYDHVVASDFDAAWALLSPTYKTWKAGNGGHAKWLAQERVDRDRLTPDGLHVEIERIDGDVATVMVTGMRFRSLTSPNCAYEGVTWARRFGGRWRYDQGYLQNATRAARWRPRRTETLGYLCESDGY